MQERDLAGLRHGHIFLGGSHDAHERRTRWVVALTALMMVAEVVAGSLFGSMALLADGFHMATHAGALAVAAAAYAFARRRAADPAFTFGTGKVGDLAGFASALTLALVALAIGAESVERLFQPARVAFGEAIAVAILGLLVNLVSAWLLGHSHDHDDDHDARHRHDRPGERHGHPQRSRHAHHDNNLRSAYFHVLADALTSLLAIGALLAGRYLGLYWMDPAMGVVGALVIAHWSWGLMRDTAAILLDTNDAEAAAAIRSRVEAAGAVVTDLHVWRVGPEARAAIVEVKGDVRCEELRDRLTDIVAVAHLTIALR